MHLCSIVLCLDVMETGIGWQHTTGSYGNHRGRGDSSHPLSQCCEAAKGILLGSDRACVGSKTAVQRKDEPNGKKGAHPHEPYAHSPWATSSKQADVPSTRSASMSLIVASFMALTTVGITDEGTLISCGGKELETRGRPPTEQETKTK